MSHEKQLKNSTVSLKKQKRRLRTQLIRVHESQTGPNHET